MQHPLQELTCEAQRERGARGSSWARAVMIRRMRCGRSDADGERERSSGSSASLLRATPDTGIQVIGASFFSFSFSIVSFSSLRSSLVPTRMMGVEGQWCRTSGYHWKAQTRKREEFHLQILKAFVDLHEFADLNLVQALRQFLWSFRLPGEAQKIDRMMEAFAQRYCTCNAGVFQSTDSCYILSFAIIMLNTSLHNPNVKEKTSLERFISMNRGIDHGGDLPSDLLTKLYESIKNEPFKIPVDDGNDLTHTFFNPDREGWLLKEGGRVKTWKRRWFILTDSCLYYFQYTTDKEPKGIIPLENLSIREVDDLNKQFCFELFLPHSKGQKIKACKTDPDGKVVIGKHQSYRISASSFEERDDWVQAIRACITKDPFYDLVSARKKKIIINNNNSSTESTN
ncbi:cytohesin-3 [Silurus meridionalis]|nr:cytohesin-3 [Silurus meridionalis]